MRPQDAGLFGEYDKETVLNGTEVERIHLFKLRFSLKRLNKPYLFVLIIND